MVPSQEGTGKDGSDAAERVAAATPHFEAAKAAAAATLADRDKTTALAEEAQRKIIKVPLIGQFVDDIQTLIQMIKATQTANTATFHERRSLRPRLLSFISSTQPMPYRT